MLKGVGKSFDLAWRTNENTFMKKVLLSLSFFALFGVFVSGCEMDGSSSEQIVQPVESVAHYTDYSAEKFEMLEGKKAVLFFYATWCSTCRKWEKQVRAEIFPEGAMVLKVDYDVEDELKAKYGVNKQSTAVFVNEYGEAEKVLADPSMDVVHDFFMAE